MIKIDVCLLLYLSATLVDGNLPPIIANVLAILSGLCLRTIPDVIKRKITNKELLIRCITLFGLLTFGYLVWLDRDIKITFIYYIAVVTVCTDLSAALVIKAILNWLNSQSKKIDSHE